jgi:hypothetical protein
MGRVLGTEDATPLEFWVVIAPGRDLQLDINQLTVVDSHQLHDRAKRFNTTDGAPHWPERLIGRCRRWVW